MPRRVWPWLRGAGRAVVGGAGGLGGSVLRRGLKTPRALRLSSPQPGARASWSQSVSADAPCWRRGRRVPHRSLARGSVPCRRATWAHQPGLVVSPDRPPSALFPLIPRIPRLTRGFSLTLHQTLRDHHLTHHLCQLCGPGRVPAHAGGRQQRSEPRPGKRGLPFLLPACCPGCALVDDTGAAAPKDTDPTSPPPAGLAEGLRALQGNLAGLGSIISVPGKYPLCRGAVLSSLRQ